MRIPSCKFACKTSSKSSSKTSSKTPSKTSRKGYSARAITLGLAGALGLLTPAEAKSPGATHCYNGICHRVATLAETEGMIGRVVTLATSFYDDCRVDRFNTCNLTSSGEVFRPDRADNAASPIYPDGTTLLVFNPANRKAAVLRVNSAGPYYGNRTLDVSRAAAERLGFRNRGTAKLNVRVMRAPLKAEATYSRNRHYQPVPGYIGEFASAEAATAGAAALLGMKPGTTPKVVEKDDTPSTPKGGGRKRLAGSGGKSSLRQAARREATINPELGKKIAAVLRSAGKKDSHRMAVARVIALPVQKAKPRLETVADRGKD